MRSLLALLLLFGCAAGAQSFHNPRRVPTPTTPIAVLAGDLNGDGVPDLIYGTETGVVPTVTAALHVLLADGNGGYTAGQDVALPAGGYPQCLLGDLNRDGVQDVVCGSRYSGVISVFPGKGDGSFGPAAILTLPDTQDQVVPAALGDVTGDGVPEVFVLFGDGLSLYALVNDGAGHLSLAQTVGMSIYGNEITLADLNEDGHPDLLVQAGSLNTAVALGKGDGTFTVLPQFSGNSGTALADVDGDGHLDLVGGQQGIVKIFHGNADGTFATSPLTTINFTSGNPTNGSGSGVYLYPFAVRDLNGDGVLDLVTFGSNGLTVLRGKPGLQFEAPRSFPVGENLSFGPRAGVQQFLDMDGDGHPDFVAPGANGIYITYGRADGSFVSADVYPSGEGVSDMTLADFDEDGIPDVVTAGDTQLFQSKGRKDGTFAPAIAIPYSLAPQINTAFKGYSQILHGDVNGDGHQDLVVAGSGSDYSVQTYVLLGRGDGTFSAPAAVPGGDGIGFLSEVIDLNGDSRDDIVKANYDGSLALFLAQGDGSYQKKAVDLMPSPTESPVAFIADVTGDGLPDLLLARAASLTVLPGLGDGRFGSGQVFPLSNMQAGLTQRAASIAVGDFDGDGQTDIAVLLTLNGSYENVTPDETQIATFYKQDGSSKLGPSSFTAAVPGPVSTLSFGDLTATDLDGDGRLDLIAKGAYYSLYADSIGTFLGQADRTFGAESDFIAGTLLSTPQLGDLNGDGRPDVVVGNLQGNAFTVLLSEGSVLATGTLRAQPKPVAVRGPFTITATVRAGTSGADLQGTVNFFVDGQSIGAAALNGGVAALAGPQTLSAGLHLLTATAVNVTSAQGTTYPTVHLDGRVVVQAQPTVLTLEASPNPATPNQQVTLTVGVTNSATAAGGVAPGGSVSLTVDGKVIGTVTLANGAASLPYSFAAPGNYTITATYGGDTGHAGSQASVVETVNTVAVVSDFRLGLSSPVLTVVLGQQGSVVTHLAGIGAYQGTLTLTCDGLPPGVTASFTPSQVGLRQGQEMDTTLLISGIPQAVALREAPLLETKSWHQQAAALVTLAALLPFGFRRRRVKLLVVAFGCVLLSTGLQGCTDLGVPLLGAGTYNLTVTATDAANKLTHSAPLQLVLTTQPTSTAGGFR